MVDMSIDIDLGRFVFVPTWCIKNHLIIFTLINQMPAVVHVHIYIYIWIVLIWNEYISIIEAVNQPLNYEWLAVFAVLCRSAHASSIVKILILQVSYTFSKFI